MRKWMKLGIADQMQLNSQAKSAKAVRPVRSITVSSSTISPFHQGV
jgi:hypothetical protein